MNQRNLDEDNKEKVELKERFDKLCQENNIPMYTSHSFHRPSPFLELRVSWQKDGSCPEFLKYILATSATIRISNTYELYGWSKYPGIFEHDQKQAVNAIKKLLKIS